MRESPTPVRVLVADDDDAGRGALASLLEEAGYDVTQASDGAGAVAQLIDAVEADRAPHVILLDVRMPGLSGLGVADAARRLRVASHVILLTAYREGSLDTLARRLGVHAVLRKPIELDAVLMAVADALR